MSKKTEADLKYYRKCDWEIVKYDVIYEKCDNTCMHAAALNFGVDSSVYCDVYELYEL